MQATSSRSWRRLEPHVPYEPLQRPYVMAHRTPSFHIWIGRPRTPPVDPPHLDDLNHDAAEDLVWPLHWCELTDADALYRSEFRLTREPRPSMSESESSDSEQ